MNAPINLDVARRRRAMREHQRGLPLAIIAEPGSVRVVIGNAEDGVELAMDPPLAHEIAREIEAAAKAAEGNPP